jgi:glutathione-regulated potassium-efflux system protein KefB
MSRNPADPHAPSLLEGPPGWLLFLYTVRRGRRADPGRALPAAPAVPLIGNLGEREMFVFAGCSP